MKPILRVLSILILTICTVKVTAQSWWTQTSGTTENLKSVQFFDDNNGMAFGDISSTIIKTSNTGAQWNSLSSSYNLGDLRSAAYLDANTIVAVGSNGPVAVNGVVMKSIDNGVSWSSDTTIPELLFDISFTDNLNGWISGENGYIARSTDGGNIWTQQSTGTGEDLFAVDFVNSNNGWAVGTVNGNATIIRTTDMGANWVTQNSGVTSVLNSVTFVDEARGWAVGAAGTIISTSDSGNTWTAQTSGTAQDLFDVSFINSNIGWAVGAAGTIKKTIDGGANWVTETSGTGQDIHSIAMRNDSLGWISGDGGVMLVYGNSLPTAVANSEVSSNDLAIFPNPATNKLNVSIEGENRPVNIKIIDSQGKTVKEVEFNNGVVSTIQCDDLRSGIYLLRAEINNGKEFLSRVCIE